MIEMLIVVLIVGMIMGMAVVQLDGFLPDSRLKQQVRFTIQMIDMASSQAVVEGRPLVLVLDRENRETRLEYHVEDGADMEVELLDVPDGEQEDDEPLFVQSWTDEVELSSLEVEDLDGESSEAEHILFFPEGSCDGAVVSWREASGMRQSLTLWPLLSKVSVSEIDDSEVFR